MAPAPHGELWAWPNPFLQEEEPHQALAPGRELTPPGRAGLIPLHSPTASLIRLMWFVVIDKFIRFFTC